MQIEQGSDSTSGKEVQEDVNNPVGQEESFDNDPFAGLDFESEFSSEEEEDDQGEVGEGEEKNDSESESSPDDEEGSLDNGESEEQKSEGDNQEPDENLPFGKHPRWKQILNERNTAKSDLDVAQTKLKQVEDLLSRSPLAALIDQTKLDEATAKKAWEALKPNLERLQRLAGVGGYELPQDLQDDLEAGLIDDARAKEIAILRARQSDSQELSKISREREEREYQQYQTQRVAQENALRVKQSVSLEIESWKKEPNFDAKYKAVQSEVDKIIRDFGTPDSPEKAVNYLRHAKRIVDASPNFAVKPKKPIDSLTSTGVRTNSETKDKFDPFYGTGL